MPVGSSLINIEKVLFDALRRNGRVAVIVRLVNHEEEGNLVDVVCDEGNRECKARIARIDGEGCGPVLIELAIP